MHPAFFAKGKTMTTTATIEPTISAPELDLLCWDQEIMDLETFMGQFVDRRILSSAELLPGLLREEYISLNYIYNHGKQTVLTGDFGLYDLEDDETPGEHDSDGELIFYVGRKNNNPIFAHLAEAGRQIFNEGYYVPTLAEIAQAKIDAVARVKVRRLRLNEHGHLHLDSETRLTPEQQSLADAVCNWSAVASQTGIHSIDICLFEPSDNHRELVTTQAICVPGRCDVNMSSYDQPHYKVKVHMSGGSSFFYRSSGQDVYAVGQKGVQVVLPPDVAIALNRGQPFTYHGVRYDANRP